MTSKEALNRLVTMCVAKDYNPNEVTAENCVKTIRLDLERLDKLEKVMQIVKRENIKIKSFIFSVYRFSDFYEPKDLCSVINNLLDCNLSQEEYDLLRSVLEDGI